MEDRKVILKIEHLCKDFDIKAKSFTGKALKLHALSDISLDIYEGETLGIIGESGCGKSTLGRCLVNLHPITSGKLVYDGKELNRLRKKERQALSREIQMVFQDPYSSLDPPPYGRGFRGGTHDCPQDACHCQGTPGKDHRPVQGSGT